MRAKTLAIVGGSLALAVLLVWTGAWVWARTFFTPVELGWTLADYLSNRCGLPAKLTQANLHMSLQHGLAIDTEPITIGDPLAGSAYVTIRKASLGIDLLSIFHKKLHVSAITLKDVSVMVTRASENIWLTPFKAGYRERAAQQSFPVEIAISQLDVTNLQLVLDDQIRQRKWIYNDGVLRTRLNDEKSGGINFPLELQFKEAHYQPQAQALQPLPPVDIRGQFFYDPEADELDIHQSQWQLPGVKASVLGHVSGFRSVWDIHLNISAEKIQLEKLFLALPYDFTRRDKFHYTLKGDGKLEASINGLFNPMPSIKGSLKLNPFLLEAPRHLQTQARYGKADLYFTEDGFELTNGELVVANSRFQYWVTMPSFYENHFIFFVESPQMVVSDFKKPEQGKMPSGLSASIPGSIASEGWRIPEDLKLEGNVTIKKINYQDAEFNDFKARVNMFNQLMQIDNIEAKAFDGDMDLIVQINAANPELLLWQGKGGLHAFNVAPLGAWLYKRSALFGLLNADLTFSGSGYSASHSLQSLNGKGNLEIIRPVLDHMPVQAHIANELKWDRLQRLYPSQNISTPISVADGKVYLPQIEVGVDNFISRSSGWVGFDHTFAFKVATVVGSEATDEFIEQLGPIVQPLKTRLGDLKANFQVICLKPGDVSVNWEKQKKAFPDNTYLSAIKLQKASLFDNPFFKDEGDDDKASALFGDSGESAADKFMNMQKKDEPKTKAEENVEQRIQREKREAEIRRKEEEERRLRELREKLPF